MKVALLREKGAAFIRHCTKPISATLPFFQRDGEGYVHRVRSGMMHYDRAGLFTHTSIHFWCGTHGFLYETGKRPRKHAYASLVTEPQAGRVVCATCEARAIGAGQVGNGKVGDHFVKFRPHVGFMQAPDPH